MNRFDSIFPQDLRQSDVALRSMILKNFPIAGTFLERVIYFFTETPIGMSLFFLTWILIVFFSYRRLQKGQAKILNFMLYTGVFALVCGLADWFCSYLKRVFGRPKPLDASKLAFPSGHSFTMFFVATFFYLILSPYCRRKFRPHIIGLFIFAILTGFSRVLLGVHYPLDVLFGFAFGAIFAWIFAPEMRRLRRYWLD